MQKIEIIGSISKDAEVKDVGNNQVINFSVAVTEKIKDRDPITTWYEIAKWGNNVAVAPYIRKGDKIFISGKPNNRSYINQQTGEAVIVNGIMAFEIELLGGSSQNQQQGQQQQQSQQPQNNYNPPNNNEDHDDLPF